MITAARTGPSTGLLFGAENDPLDVRGRADAAKLSGSLIGGPVSGPERSVRETAELAEAVSAVDDDLRGLNVGYWKGIAPQDVSPADLQAWLTDPRFDAHGGESIAALTARMSSWLDRVGRRGKPVTAVVATTAASALVAAAFDDADRFFSFEIAPATVVDLSHRRHWRLMLR